MTYSSGTGVNETLGTATGISFNVACRHTGRPVRTTAGTPTAARARLSPSGSCLVAAASLIVREAEEHPQGDHLTLPQRQAAEERHDRRIGLGGADCRIGPGRAWRPGIAVTGVIERHLPAPSPPRRDAEVQRRLHHPGPRHRVRTDFPPGRPGAGECLGYAIFSRLPVADAGVDRPQAVVSGFGIELDGTRLLRAHDCLYAAAT